VTGANFSGSAARRASTASASGAPVWDGMVTDSPLSW
jgi:hypothetical protein